MSSFEPSLADNAIFQLYVQILTAWNNRDAAAMAKPFTVNGNMVGYDGSQINSRAEIVDHLRPIFADHPTAAYVAKVREIRLLVPHAALLRAVAGMIPPQGNDLNPALHTIHTLVAIQDEANQWQVALFQSTPAAWHGRPQDSAALTDELRTVVQKGLICV